MSQRPFRSLLVLLLMALLVPTGAIFARTPISPAATVKITILHTNDFHGNLQASGSNPGMARTAQVIATERAAAGAENTLLLDAGDIMQGSLLSNMYQGESSMDVFNLMGYQAATVGNHEFDWDQTVLATRIGQAQFPFVAANLVVNDTGNCSTAGWQQPAYIQPWITKTAGPVGNEVKIGIIGVTSIETPFITKETATQGLCFKDPVEAVEHYYDAVKADGAQAIVILSHIGYTDGGYGYGFPVYGDQTLARELATDGKPANLIIGGHTHTNLTSATLVDGTTVVQAYYAGRKVGKADLTIDTTTGNVSVAWTSLAVSTSGAEDATVKARIDQWANNPTYQAKVSEVIGWSNVDLVRNTNGDSAMGSFVQDAIYNDLNQDATPANDADIVFNNPGGLRADVVKATKPFTMTYGDLFNVLPFGNATVVGDMTGAQILDLLNQSASLFKGAIQVSGIRYKFYSYSDSVVGAPQPWAWGAFDAEVKSRTSGDWEPLDLTRTYRVATNEFLAPAGQDGYSAFKYMTNISYWGDMLDGMNRWVRQTYTAGNPYNATLDGRITRVGPTDGTYNPADPTQIVPITILHHNDPHGRLTPSGSYPGYTNLATIIKRERVRNPGRTLLLNGGDSIQGDSMMYYFKSAALGYAADGTALEPALRMNPIIAAMNAMDYDAMALGNHEFNFGSDVFTSTLEQANFALLAANIYDNGQYGLAQVGATPYITRTLPGPAGDIKLAVLGIGNHRVPSYELPSNIRGLTFTNPITEAQRYVPQLRQNNDAVVALTHIGFTGNPRSVEVDSNVDTNLAAQVAGIDAIIGAHSHTDPSKQTDSSGSYKYLPAMVASSDNTPVLINQAYRYNTYLGEVALGLRVKQGGGYEVVSRAGRDIAITTATAEDAEVKAIVDPYVARLAAYNSTVVGQTQVPIDTMSAFTQETNGANLQADASVWELGQHGIDTDVHISGAMTNKLLAPTATITNPTTLTISDMFGAMPYENSLVVLRMNGPQLKAVLERGYRNYYYYKYVPSAGGYSYYTTCMLDTDVRGTIRYRDTSPWLPDGNNVISFQINGTPVDFKDANTFYNVSTVNYLAAGACNFSDSGSSLWPLGQIVADTQYYVRDAVIDYIHDRGVVAPAIEQRLNFLALDKIVFLPIAGK